MEYNMRDLLEEKFKDDPIYREIQINKIDLEDVFTNGILDMHPETTYSTVEAGKIIDRKDSTIRNYFRTELEDYIAPERSGKFYRLNYQSVFRMHMILLLVDKVNKTTVDIGYALGYQALSSTSDGLRQPKRRSNEEVGLEPYQEDTSNQMNEIKKMMLIQNMKHVELQEKSTLTNLKVDLANIDREIDSIKNSIEISRLTEEKDQANKKYYKVLDYSLRNTRAGNKETKKGFWSLFKPQNDEEEVDIDKILNDASINAEQEVAATSELDAVTKELNARLIKLEESKKDKEKEIDKQVLKIGEVKEKVKYLNNPENEISIDQISKILIESEYEE